MRSLDIEFLRGQMIPIEIGGLLQKLGEYKGRQELFTRQTPQILATLKQIAVIESTESSNRIEGITVNEKRFKELMAHPEKPKDRSEGEILGYRKVLSKIHTSAERFIINETAIREMHKEIYALTTVNGGNWKRTDNTIEEKTSDGRWITRFVPVSARETPYFMKELCVSYNRILNSEQVSPLILIPAFIFDFLCIHPFLDGNGRVSRLLTVLLLNQADYSVGKYISIERLIEESKETYYEVLQSSSKGWHQGKHNLKSWWEYSLGILMRAYQEFEGRVGKLILKRGTKTAIIEEAIKNLSNSFSISDIERSCSGISRDMIRVILKRLRAEGLVRCMGTGRNALWEKRGNKINKHSNKHGNNK